MYSLCAESPVFLIRWESIPLMPVSRRKHAVICIAHSNDIRFFPHIRIGDVKEAQGDLRGARQAYGKAKRLFDEQYPKSYEDPLFLIQKIADLDARLRNP